MQFYFSSIYYKVHFLIKSEVFFFIQFSKRYVIHTMKPRETKWVRVEGYCQFPIIPGLGIHTNLVWITSKWLLAKAPNEDLYLTAYYQWSWWARYKAILANRLHNLPFTMWQSKHSFIVLPLSLLMFIIC